MGRAKGFVFACVWCIYFNSCVYRLCEMLYFTMQDHRTPFELAVAKGHSGVVRYFFMELHMDTSQFDEVIIVSPGTHNLRGY